jgi:transposase-like protein
MVRPSSNGIEHGSNDWFAELETGREAQQPSVDPGRAPRKTGIVPVEARAAEERQQSGESWDEARKAALVAQIAEAQATVGMACERYGLRPDEVQDWLRAFRRSALMAFDARLTENLVGQGADPTVLTAAEFTGRLDEVSVIDLIQSVHMARQSAIIMVTHDGLESRVWCSRGTVIDAESGRLKAEAALHRIVSFDHGRVVADFRSVPRARTIQTPTSRLLLEAAHRKDESVRLWRRLGAGQPAYRVTELAKASLTRLSPTERTLLESLDEPRSLLDALRDSDLGDVETLTLLARLIDSRFIEPDASVVSSGNTRGGRDEMASLLPLMDTRPSERGSTVRRRVPTWVWGALGAVALLLPMPWLSNGAPEPKMAPTGPLSAPASPAEPVASYSVAWRIEPSNAEIWLDGRHVGSGRLETVLPKNGSAHELRAVADGYLPTVVVFLDTPPPSEVRLQPIPLPAAPLPAAPLPAAPLPAVPPPVRSDAKLISKATLARPAPWRPRAKAPARRPQSAREPQIRGIDADTPQIQVIE